MRFFATFYWRAAGLALLLGVSASIPATAQDFGSFKGDFIVKYLPGGRLVELQNDVTYLAPGGGKWTAPKGLVSDGASIPYVLWSIIGGPFSGSYRNAAVIHDQYCETKSKPWRKVHKMFYTASRAGGTGSTRAKLMYYAVYRFGPRWWLSRTLKDGSDSSVIIFKPKLVRSEFDAMKARIERGEVDIPQIERDADRSLRSLSRSIID